MSRWCLEVWGDYACFTRPEMKVERVSYDVITPSAARAIFEAILWKPAIKWNITKIEVMNPIKWASIRRNEVGWVGGRPTQDQLKGHPTNPMGVYIEDRRQQRAGLILKDVRYRLYGYFDYLGEADNSETDAEGGMAKFAAMFQRRARKGQCFHRPYLGCREFSCHFKLIENDDENLPIDESRDLGFMLYDMDFERDSKNPPPLFYRPAMVKGAINTDRSEIEVFG
ncbi:MAG TPA: type I-C CRISPR-associated protein Cas5 [Tissierellia bacterium]|jgi:CRISPR-associated protein Cas5d|nr:type I-C CRISPR-associated protein Cas5 [Tissierellia bacterium]